jgi:FkbM family methyltransferase
VSCWKRALARRIGDALDVHIVPKGWAAPLLEEELLGRLLREFAIDCVFDVGANAGQYAKMLRRVGYRGPIVSFEPIPTLAAQLRTAAAKDPRWFVEALALDEVRGDATFNVMANNEFSSLRSPSHAETTRFEELNVVVETIAVKTGRLDELFDRYQARLGFRLPFLKMDTQGNDLAVARGAGDRLLRFAALQSELAIKRLYDGQHDYRDALDFYQASGFVLSGFIPNNLGHFPDLIEIDCIMYNPAVISKDVHGPR